MRGIGTAGDFLKGFPLNRYKVSELQNSIKGVIPAKAVVQKLLKKLDTRFRGYDHLGLLQLALVFIFAVSFFLMGATISWAADKISKIEVFPPTPYDGYIIYESLAVFWLFIISLIVIIRMKLREIERIQELGVEEEDPDAPMLR